ncbi:MAG: hypothetical protein FJ395_02010 [Verrucomicrobia bacterium]|nr:hypothetical protein [Verrucomicrobiota bacterium]
MKSKLLFAVFLAGVFTSTRWAVSQQMPDMKLVESTWKSGQTLPPQLAAHFPNSPLKVNNDTGINVLVDLAHQCAFATMWGLPGKLHSLGFRSIVSHASLDTVLTPGKFSRMRIPISKADDGKAIRAFGWVPNPRFNVVITLQSDPNAQSYLPEERAALDSFVKNGGGLVIVDNGIGRQKKQLAAWADQSLATTFGVDFKSFIAGKSNTLLGPAWQVTPAISRRVVGKGRVVLVSSFKEIESDKKASKQEAAAKQAVLKEIVTWAAGGSAPVGGEARFSQTQGGGGGIYPELEERLKGAVVYYARNQKANLLQAVRQELPKITDSLYAWLPSPVPQEPMVIILAAGGGGGWAVNAFYPKETGVISLDTVGLFGVFAHELGHTMSGPRNAKGETAANWFDGNQGEAHAGWWQGKILAIYSKNKSMRDCNDVFKFDKNAAELDLTQKQEKGKAWKKLWWIWQKLDDRYGTTLTRSRLERIAFQGKTIELPVAPLQVSPAGNARHDPIGDYTKPVPLR